MLIDITKRPVQTALCGLGIVAALGLAAPTATFAETVNNLGTTQVTVKADGNRQLAFEVPTVIPFLATAKGTLIGPSDDALLIKNKSVFPITVAAVRVDENAAWTYTTDVDSGINTANFYFGPSSEHINATDAATNEGIATKALEWDMSYEGSGKDIVQLEVGGKIGKTEYSLNVPASLGSITFAFTPGNHMR